MQNIKKHPYGGYYKYDEAVAKTYDNDRSTEKHWIEENAFVEQYFKIHKVEKLLDLPVGTGRFFNFYKNINQLTGIDISEAMLTEARKNLQLLDKTTHVTLQKGDVFNLSFLNDSFDCILVFRLLHLIPQNKLEGAIKELCRVGNRDIVVQSYEQISISFFQLIKRKIKYKLKIILKLKTKQQDNKGIKPWSHIEAYFHEYGLINLYFKKYGFKKKKEILLSHYDGANIYVTIYAKI